MDGVNVNLTNETSGQAIYSIFSNVAFLLAFFGTLGFYVFYHLYYYITKKGAPDCSEYTSDKECKRDTCEWDSNENKCLNQEIDTSICPDYWKATNDKHGFVKCTDVNKVAPDKTCYATDASSTNGHIYVKNNEVFYGNTKSARHTGTCDWMNKCGSWDGQAQGRIGCDIKQGILKECDAESAGAAFCSATAAATTAAATTTVK